MVGALRPRGRARSPGLLVLAPIVFGLGLLGGPRHATAQARVAVVAPDARLASVLGDALRPWDVSIVLIAGVGPGASMPASADGGRELAEAEAAAAVVWLSESAEGWAVWVYDAATDRAMARRLPVGPPFDEATAAAIALSVMAMLRHSAAAPERERMREPASVMEPEPVREPPPAMEPEVPPPMRTVRLELAAGAEGWATDPDQVEPRVALAAGWWPEGWGGLGGVALVLRAGTGTAIDQLGVAARLFDVRAALRGHLRGTFDRLLLVGALVEVGLRVLALDGTHESGRGVGDVRAAGLLSLAAELGLDLDPVSIALRVGANATAWLASYEVDSAPVLTSQALWPFAELILEVGLR